MAHEENFKNVTKFYEGGTCFDNVEGFGMAWMSASSPSGDSASRITGHSTNPLCGYSPLQS